MMSASRPTLIINARLVDPLSGKEERGALAVEHGVIAEVGHAIDATAPKEGALVIDAALFVPQSRPRLFIVAVGHTFNFKRDYYIPAEEVAATEDKRTMQLAQGA